jgi:hypothetical protein
MKTYHRAINILNLRGNDMVDMTSCSFLNKRVEAEYEYLKVDSATVDAHREYVNVEFADGSSVTYPADHNLVVRRVSK